MKWMFTPKSPGERTRDPISSEFFASDSIKNAGEALIREAIQNSLDARIDRSNGKARVRVYVSGEKASLVPDSHRRWFDSAWPHYQAERNGLMVGTFSPQDRCRYLVFEDFGTTGLLGDPLQYELKPGVKNLFFYFFRAEGATEKDADRLGRWGIGKQVFPRSSLAQTLFGYSVTTSEGSEANGFLMGSCILKHHSVGGVVYRPDGYFSDIARLGGGDELPVPISEQDLLNTFRKDFRITRKPGETGLSVVVPWLDDRPMDGARSFDRETLVYSIIEGYFLPILEGKLEASVEDENMTMKIAADNLTTILDGIELTADEKRKKAIRGVRARIRLALQVRARQVLTFALPECPESKAVWSEEMLNEELALNIRQALTEGGAVEVRAALTVRPKTGASAKDFFCCYLQRDDGLSQRPCHIREELIVSDVGCAKINGFACLVHIPKGHLANLLGDSENPAHTEWQPSSRNFKDKYTYGGLAIDFVSHFGAELLRRVFASSRQLDRGLLMNYFSDPGPETPDKNTRTRKDDEKDDDTKTTPPPQPPPPPPPPELTIGDLEDGFSISSTGGRIPIDAVIDVLAAYETTKGNPFKAYQRYDFDFGKPSLRIDAKGCDLVEPNENRLGIRVKAPEFRVSVSGFDTNRDVVVKTVHRSSSDDEAGLVPTLTDEG